MSKKPARTAPHRSLKSSTPPPVSVKESPCIFVDTEGRTWDCTLTLAGATRVDSSDFSELGVKSFSILSPSREDLRVLVTNKALTFAVIWAIVQPQVREYHRQGKFKSDPVEAPWDAQSEFMEGIDGDTITKGMEAMIDSLGNFTPEVRNVLSAFKKQAEKGRERLKQEIEKMIPQMQEASDKLLETSVRTLKKETAKILEELPGTLSGGQRQSPTSPPKTFYQKNIR